MRRATFPIKDIRALIESVKKGSGHRVAYTGGSWEGSPPLDTTPSLEVVGDEGIYVMGNHKEHKPGDEVYSREANPNSDDCWGSKRYIFGGDDGIVSISLKDVEDILSTAGVMKKGRLVHDKYFYAEFTDESVKYGTC